MFNLIVLILVTIVFLMFGYLITHADIFSPFCVFCEMFLIAEFLCLFFVRMYKVEIHLKTILVIALGTISFGIVSAFFNMKRVDVRNYGEQHSRNYISINYLIQLVFLILEVLVVFYHAKYIKDVVAAFGYIGMEWLYKALEQYTYITVRSVIFKFIALIFMFFLVHKQTDYVIYGGITIFAASASNILNLINAHKFINLKPVGNYNFRRHLKPVLIFFAMSCATTIYTNLDTVMLGFMTTDTDVGYYNAAVKIKVILVSVVTSLGTVLLPRASYYIQRGELKEFHRITRKALNFVFLMATPLFVYFIYFAKEGIFFLSGNNYVGSIIPMQVIMPTLLLIGITNILGIQILVPTGREKIVLYSEIVGAVVDVIINALLIPVYASTGAAIGTLVAEFAVFVVQFYALKDEILNTFRQIHYIKILIALSVGSIVSLWVKILNLECFFSLVISSLLFFGAYGFVLLILKEELFLEIFNTIKNKII
jgi:O-antigen/teichoic acid export membrane protein